MFTLHFPRPAVDIHPGAGTGERPHSSSSTIGDRTASPAITPGGGEFGSPLAQISNLEKRYSTLGKNLRRMQSSESETSSHLSRSQSASPFFSRSVSRQSDGGSVPDSGAIAASPARFQTKQVTYKGQEYVTTVQPTFPNGTHYLFKTGGKQSDAIVAKPLPGGGWADTSPVKSWQSITIDGQTYGTSKTPNLDDGHYLIYPITPNGFIKANDAREAKLLPNGEWNIVSESQNTPLSTPSPPSSRAASTSPSDAVISNREPSVFQRFWTAIKNIFQVPHHAVGGGGLEEV